MKTWTYTSVSTMFKKSVFNVHVTFACAPSANIEEAGFMTYTAASHQGAVKMVEHHFW